MNYTWFVLSFPFPLEIFLLFVLCCCRLQTWKTGVEAELCPEYLTVWECGKNENDQYLEGWICSSCELSLQIRSRDVCFCFVSFTVPHNPTPTTLHSIQYDSKKKLEAPHWQLPRHSSVIRHVSSVDHRLASRISVIIIRKIALVNCILGQVDFTPNLRLFGVESFDLKCNQPN
jgi:hypothetical protein